MSSHYLSSIFSLSPPSLRQFRSLVLLSSYSGNTEETLAARNKPSKLVPGSSHRVEQTADLAVANQWPMYLIDATNPSNQPRMAIGYAVFGRLSMFAKMDLSIFQERY